MVHECQWMKSRNSSNTWSKIMHFFMLRINVVVVVALGEECGEGKNLKLSFPIKYLLLFKVFAANWMRKSFNWKLRDKKKDKERRGFYPSLKITNRFIADVSHDALQKGVFALDEGQIAAGFGLVEVQQLVPLVSGGRRRGHEVIPSSLLIIVVVPPFISLMSNG